MPWHDPAADWWGAQLCATVANAHEELMQALSAMFGGKRKLRTHKPGDFMYQHQANQPQAEQPDENADSDLEHGPAAKRRKMAKFLIELKAEKALLDKQKRKAKRTG